MGSIRMIRVAGDPGSQTGRDNDFEPYFDNSIYAGGFDIATHDHDPTYGSSLGSLQLFECRTCGAATANRELHVQWHRTSGGR